MAYAMPELTTPHSCVMSVLPGQDGNNEYIRKMGDEYDKDCDSNILINWELTSKPIVF